MNLSSVTWRKSSYTGSNGGNCVEVTTDVARAMATRASNDPDAPSSR